MIQKNQKGFAIVEVTILVAIVGVVVGLGWHVWRTKHAASQNNNQTVSSQTSQKALQQSPGTAQKAPSLSQSATTEQPSSPTPQSSTATASQPTTSASSNTSTQPTSTATDTSTSSPKTARVYELYNISADGSTAQETPVQTTLKNTSSVTITIDLQCSGTCNFKLVSDSYPLANTTTYTSSQKIAYTVSKPGSYIFYNQYTPNAKFKISF